MFLRVFELEQYQFWYRCTKRWSQSHGELKDILLEKKNTRNSAKSQ